MVPSRSQEAVSKSRCMHSERVGALCLYILRLARQAKARRSRKRYSCGGESRKYLKNTCDSRPLAWADQMGGDPFPCRPASGNRSGEITHLRALAPPPGRCAGPGRPSRCHWGARRDTGPLCPSAWAPGVLGSSPGRVHSANLLPPATTSCKPASTAGSTNFQAKGAPLLSPS